MRFEDVKLNGKYRVTNNETEHGFDVGDVVQIIAIEPTEDGEHLIRAKSWTKPWRGEWYITPEEMKSILEAKDRQKAGKTLPAHGLFLKNVEYE